MKLVYSKSCTSPAEMVHRFDVLGDLLPNDLDVMKNSLSLFFRQLGRSPDPSVSRLVVVDLSECTVKVNEPKLQAWASEVKGMALASEVFFTLAQTDIESMLAEQKTIEQSLLQKINVLENRIDLALSVKNRTSTFEKENEELREKIKEREANPRRKSFADKLWGDS